MTSLPEIWVLGATGRSGSDIASILVKNKDVTTVIVGRNQERLDTLATTLPGSRAEVAAGPDAIIQLIKDKKPAVVVNMLGDYANAGVAIARAAVSSGTHYTDLAADLASVPLLLGLHDEAIAGGATVVPGSGYGVVGTQGAVARLCEGSSREARHIHVDGLPAMATKAAGTVGDALAHSIIDGMAGGGKQIMDGKLVSAPMGTYVELTTPDGDKVTCGAVPAGDLIAAQRCSGVPDVSVTANSSYGPAGLVARLAIPVVSTIMLLGPVKRYAQRYLASVQAPAAPMPRKHTWGHAVITFDDGTEQEAWLQAGDASDFTSAVCSEVALRLARGTKARPGAYTPCEIFGSEIAEAAGAKIILV